MDRNVKNFLTSLQKIAIPQTQPSETTHILLNFQKEINFRFFENLSNENLIFALKSIWISLFKSYSIQATSNKLLVSREVGFFLSRVTPFFPDQMSSAFSEAIKVILNHKLKTNSSDSEINNKNEQNNLNDEKTDEKMTEMISIIAPVAISSFSYISKAISSPIVSNFFRDTPILEFFNTKVHDFSEYIAPIIPTMKHIGYEFSYQLFKHILKDLDPFPTRNVVRTVSEIIFLYPTHFLPESIKILHDNLRGYLTIYAYLFTSFDITINEIDIQHLGTTALSVFSEQNPTSQDIDDALQILSVFSNMMIMFTGFSNNNLANQTNSNDDNKDQNSIKVTFSIDRLKKVTFDYSLVKDRSSFYRLPLSLEFLTPKQTDNILILSSKYKTLAKLSKFKKNQTKISQIFNDILSQKEFTEQTSEALIALSRCYKYLQIDLKLLKKLIFLPLNSWLHSMNLLNVVKEMKIDDIDDAFALEMIDVLIQFILSKNSLLSGSASNLIIKFVSIENHKTVVQKIINLITFFDSFYLTKFLPILAQIFSIFNDLFEFNWFIYSLIELCEYIPFKLNLETVIFEFLIVANIAPTPKQTERIKYATKNHSVPSNLCDFDSSDSSTFNPNSPSQASNSSLSESISSTKSPKQAEKANKMPLSPGKPKSSRNKQLNDLIKNLGMKMKIKNSLKILILNAYNIIFVSYEMMTGKTHPRLSMQQEDQLKLQSKIQSFIDVNNIDLVSKPDDCFENIFQPMMTAIKLVFKYNLSQHRNFEICDCMFNLFPLIISQYIEENWSGYMKYKNSPTFLSSLDKKLQNVEDIHVHQVWCRIAMKHSHAKNAIPFLNIISSYFFHQNKSCDLKLVADFSVFLMSTFAEGNNGVIRYLANYSPNEISVILYYASKLPNSLIMLNSFSDIEIQEPGNLKTPQSFKQKEFQFNYDFLFNESTSNESTKVNKNENQEKNSFAHEILIDSIFSGKIENLKKVLNDVFLKNKIKLCKIDQKIPEKYSKVIIEWIVEHQLPEFSPEDCFNNLNTNLRPIAIAIMKKKPEDIIMYLSQTEKIKKKYLLNLLTVIDIINFDKEAIRNTASILFFEAKEEKRLLILLRLLSNILFIQKNDLLSDFYDDFFNDFVASMKEKENMISALEFSFYTKNVANVTKPPQIFFDFVDEYKKQFAFLSNIYGNLNYLHLKYFEDKDPIHVFAMHEEEMLNPFLYSFVPSIFINGLQQFLQCVNSMEDPDSERIVDSSVSAIFSTLKTYINNATGLENSGYLTNNSENNNENNSEANKNEMSHSKSFSGNQNYIEFMPFILKHVTKVVNALMSCERYEYMNINLCNSMNQFLSISMTSANFCYSRKWIPNAIKYTKSQIFMNIGCSLLDKSPNLKILKIAVKCLKEKILLINGSDNQSGEIMDKILTFTSSMIEFDSYEIGNYLYLLVDLLNDANENVIFSSFIQFAKCVRRFEPVFYAILKFIDMNSDKNFIDPLIGSLLSIVECEWHRKAISFAKDKSKREDAIMLAGIPANSPVGNEILMSIE
ncbi:hypothetical protein TRFO_15909 [Tritrichomonas foetus]|uniref:Uncharacterized protein n=1 Tax=Tritrichomonas foetus TaxID=1144522 RepID=A0A1J4KRG7_9EUKA|nr:hypothetical protein TRFO_15909 [Tritrichomonas foetus]|eukprot:OHT13881.1 hypothetical protein TRFO_15909 [Tritrichomonas foetus]